jgi:hypothetical protein
VGGLRGEIEDRLELGGGRGSVELLGETGDPFLGSDGPPQRRVGEHRGSYARRGAARVWWLIRPSKPAGRGSPTLGRFDSFAAPPRRAVTVGGAVQALLAMLTARDISEPDIPEDDPDAPAAG